MMTVIHDFPMVEKEKRKKKSKSYLIKINCKDLRVLFES